MGKKYIIELLDECNSKFKGIMVFGLTREKQISVELIPEESLRPYTEPDLEQVRKEAYEQGRKDVKTQFCSYDACKNHQEEYLRGLSDAWEAARKIALDKEDGGLDTAAYCETFGYGKGFGTVLKTFTASEAIEKIRQYEQEKEEQIHVGDEVEAVSGKAVVVYVDDVDEHKVRYVYSNGVYAFDYIDKVTKTGRHFPEIAEVLQKMKEK